MIIPEDVGDRYALCILHGIGASAAIIEIPTVIHTSVQTDNSNSTLRAIPVKT